MKLPGFISENADLARFTTFRIGGRARWLAEPGTRHELADALELAEALGARILILGGGSNLLVSDFGVDAMVVRLRGDGEFGIAGQRDDDPMVWRVGAAVPLPVLVAATAKCGVFGMETLAGIPGTVGGAVTMNCGGTEGGVGDWVTEVEAFTMAGEPVVERPPRLCFYYRGSTLAGLLAVRFVLRFRERGDPEAVQARARECRDWKRLTQPVSLASAGCVFKNPSGMSAGKLLDAAGCKGMREGEAEVSDLHANFIINRGCAHSTDVATLALRMREAVFAEAGIVLEPEIKLWGEEPSFLPLREGVQP